nr:leucine-rich repeat-containing protein 34 isoform X8 [Odocoileus virginianus texanus]
MAEKQRNLIYLNLMFNDIGPDGGELIAKALHKNRTLKHLRMTGNKIENKGGMFFAAMLQINSSLEKLDLGDCDLGMQSVIAFATVLTQNQTIKGLNLNRPILYGEQEESTVHLSHMLKENQCLIELHICKHDIKNCGMKQLCDALYLNRSLQYLDVSCNKITQDGMKYLADVLKSNTTLEVIDLSFNRMENAGANYLSDALASHNRTLKALSVVSNNIEGKGLVALSQSMETNPTLSHIYIWGNKFDGATCVAYSDLIHTGRLKPDNTDVEPFVVDGHVYLAEVSNGLKRHYYWTPGYGEACSPSSNAGFSLAPVSRSRIQPAVSCCSDSLHNVLSAWMNTSFPISILHVSGSLELSLPNTHVGKTQSLLQYSSVFTIAYILSCNHSYLLRFLVSRTRL